MCSNCISLVKRSMMKAFLKPNTFQTVQNGPSFDLSDQPMSCFRQEVKLIIIIYFFSAILFIYNECTKSGSLESSRNQTARDTAPLPMGSRRFLASTQPKRSFSKLFTKLHSQCLFSLCPQMLFSPLLCFFSCFSWRHTHSHLPRNVTTVCPSKESSEAAFALESPTFSVGTSIVSAI